MTGVWWWIAAMVVVGVLAVVVRFAVKAQQRRTLVHDEWLHSVLLSDREVQRIRQWFEREARERDGEPRA